MAKLFEFTFTIKSEGDTPDEALQSIRSDLQVSLARLFSGFIDYEELTVQERTLVTYAEELLLNTQDLAES